jgi:hypothetical protein
MLIVLKTNTLFYELILLLKLKKAEDVTCFNWKFPALSDLKINEWTEQNEVVAVCLTF